MTDPISPTAAPDTGPEFREAEPYYAVGLSYAPTTWSFDSVSSEATEALKVPFFRRNHLAIEGRRSIPVLWNGFRLEPWLSAGWFWENNGSSQVASAQGAYSTNLSSNGVEIDIGARATHLFGSPVDGTWGLTAGPFVYLERGSYGDSNAGVDPGKNGVRPATYEDYVGTGIGLQIGPTYRTNNVDMDLVFEWAVGKRWLSYDIVGRELARPLGAASASAQRLGARFTIVIHGDAETVFEPPPEMAEAPPEPVAEDVPAPEPPVPAGPAAVTAPVAPTTTVTEPPPAEDEAAAAASVSDSATAATAVAAESRPAAATTAAAATTGTAGPICGDGKVDRGEECDDGNKNNDDDCTNACKKKVAPAGPVCGDRKKEGTEQCDDGNKAAGDGCDPNCQTETVAPAAAAAPAVPEYHAPAVSKPAQKTDLAGLKEELGRKFYWQVAYAMDYAFDGMEVGIRDRIIAVYTPAGGTFNRERFLKDFAGVALAKLRRLQWEQKKGFINDDGILNPHSNSDAEAATFTLGDVNRALKGVGKDIVIGAVFIEAAEAKVIRTLTETSLFTKYGTTARVGIVKASDCAPGHVTIQFGQVDAETNSVTVVNENKNLLSTRGIQHWRLASPKPSGCPAIHNIGTNIGLQAIFPYQHSYKPGDASTKKDGFVVIYLLMATPGTQLGASKAMENTLEAIEELSDGSEAPTL